MNKGALHILLVDHKRASREAHYALFERAGYHVTLAANGADALEHALDTPFDICIIDSNLTDMDGFTVSERMRQESEGDPTIIMMVDPYDDLRKSYLSQMVTYVGGDYFFAKPCDEHLLLMLLGEIDETRGSCGPNHPTASPSGARMTTGWAELSLR